MNNQNTTPTDASVALTFNLVVYPEAEGEEPIQYVLNASRICLGRGPGSQIRVNHPAISFSHLELVKNESGDYEVVDLGSKNGLSINNEKVTRAVMKDGDRLLIGGAVAAYFLILPDDAEAVDPVTVVGSAGRGKLGQFAELAERTRNLETEYQSHESLIVKLEAALEQVEAQLLRYQGSPEASAAASKPQGGKEGGSKAVQVPAHSVELVNRLTNGSESPQVNRPSAGSGHN